MVAKLWRWQGDGCLSSELIFSLLWTLIASIDIHDLQSLCELHKPCLLSPLTTLYKAGCHALWPQLIPEYLLVKDLHGPPLGSLCSLCQWMDVEGSPPFLPNLSLDLFRQLPDTMYRWETFCFLAETTQVWAETSWQMIQGFQRKVKTYFRWALPSDERVGCWLASWTMGCWYLLFHPLACQVVWQSSLVSGLGFRRTATMFQVRCENSPCS